MKDVSFEVGCRAHYVAGYRRDAKQGAKGCSSAGRVLSDVHSIGNRPAIIGFPSFKRNGPFCEANSV